MRESRGSLRHVPYYLNFVTRRDDLVKTLTGPVFDLQAFGTY